MSNPYSGQPYSGPLEQQVLCADSVELVSIMFDHLVASVMEARQHLTSGDRLARAHSISRALGLVGELSNSLDTHAGGEFARTLKKIYAFVVDRLVQAHTQQLEQPLIKAAEALRPLRDAWKELNRSRSAEDLASVSGGLAELNLDSNMSFSLSA